MVSISWEKLVFLWFVPYNSEKYIKRTLEMLLKQKKLPNEVIFCDDGSNDNTLKILNIYSNILKKKS